MILRELFYYDDTTLEMTQDDRYEPEFDDSILDLDDTRKTKLTLAQINRARKASELHNKDKSQEREFIQSMYGAMAQDAAAAV